MNKTYFFFAAWFAVAGCVSNGAKSLSAESAVESIRPNDVVTQFDADGRVYNGDYVTSVFGVGHAPYTLEFVTFRRVGDQIKVLTVAYSGGRKHSGSHAIGSAKDKAAPAVDFEHRIYQGEMDHKRFHAFMGELSRLHHMKTFKEYRIPALNPIGGESGGAKSHGGTVAGTGVMMSSANSVHVMNVWDSSGGGFRYSIAGHSSTELNQQALKARAMNRLVKDVVEELTLSPVTRITKDLKDVFNHQLAVLQPDLQREKWWWVKERASALDRVFTAKENQ